MQGSGSSEKNTRKFLQLTVSVWARHTIAVHVCIHVRIHIHVCVHAHAYTYMHVYVYMHMYVYMYMSCIYCTYIHVHVSPHVHVVHTHDISLCLLFSLFLLTSWHRARTRYSSGVCSDEVGKWAFDVSNTDLNDTLVFSGYETVVIKPLPVCH